MIEYLPILLYICVSALLSGIILSLSFFVSSQKPDPEKTSAYECGFDPFEDARRPQCVLWLVAGVKSKERLSRADWS